MARRTKKQIEADKAGEKIDTIEEVVEVVEDVIEDVVDAVEDVIEDVVDFAEGAIDAFTDWWNNTGEELARSGPSNKKFNAKALEAAGKGGKEAEYQEALDEAGVGGSRNANLKKAGEIAFKL